MNSSNTSIQFAITIHSSHRSVSIHTISFRPITTSTSHHLIQTHYYQHHVSPSHSDPLPPAARLTISFRPIATSSTSHHLIQTHCHQQHVSPSHSDPLPPARLCFPL